MQRRAAAISVVFFMLLAAGAYAVVGAAEEPTVEMSGEYTLQTGDAFTVNGTTYTATEVANSNATIEWVNESARFTHEFENNTTVSYQNDSYDVIIPNVSAPQNFTLRESSDVSAILSNDSAVENETVTFPDGEERVIYTANDSAALLSDYLSPRDTVTVELGEQFQYNGTETNVSSITPEVATLTWFGPKNRTVDVAAGTNTTLDRTYVAHFSDPNTLVLSTEFEDYQSQLEAQREYNERIAGLWGVTIVGSLASVLLIGMAYLPSRY